jgi:hypothetical protein
MTMTATRTRDPLHRFGEGILPDEPTAPTEAEGYYAAKDRHLAEVWGSTHETAPTGVQCRPLPKGPDHDDDQYHSGYTIGRAGNQVSMYWRTAAFLDGYCQGRQEWLDQLKSN